MTQQFPWKLAWITGASGAIGGELAKRLAAGGVTIAATARPSARLDALARSDAKIKPYPADVLDAPTLKACAARIEAELGPIDLALFGAGMYVPFDIRNIDTEGFRDTMALNVDGVINAVAAVLPSMLARKSGHIAIMGSLFGYSGWPETGSYGASKAAVINLAESLKIELEPEGIDVTIINPGFVDTPLNASYDAKKKLYVMSKERCARKILEKLPAKPYEIAFPPQVSGFLKTVRGLPKAVSFPLIRWFHKRAGSLMKPMFEMLAGYNSWANRRLYAAAASLPNSDYRADRGAFFGSVHGTLNHLLVADHIWMHRFSRRRPEPYAARCHPL